MLTKIITIIAAITAFGILSRLLFYILHRKSKSITSILIVNVATFILTICLATFLLKDILQIENIIHSIQLLIAPLFIWIVIDSIQLPKQKDRTIKIYNSEHSVISLIALASVLISLASIITYPTKNQRAANQLIDEINTLVDRSNESNPGTNDDITLLDQNPILEGEAGEHEKLLREIINRGISLKLDYHKELQEADVHLLLDPSRLRGALNLAHTQKIHQESLAIIENYQTRNVNLLEIARENVENLDLNPREKDLVRYEFNKYLAQTKEKIKNQWAMEKSVIEIMIEIATWLGENNEAWIFDNEQYLFYSENDINYYNEKINKLNEILIKQTEVQQTSLDQLNSDIKSLK